MFHNNKECIIKNGNKGIVFPPHSHVNTISPCLHGKLHCLKLEQRTPYLTKWNQVLGKNHFEKVFLNGFSESSLRPSSTLN